MTREHDDMDRATATATATTPAPATAEVVIGDRAVGDGWRAYVIAEAGVNHDGRVDGALRLVDVAVDAGADAVKFQWFRADDLVTRDAPAAAYQSGAGASASAGASAGVARAHEMLRRLELDDAAFERIRAHCADRGIAFLATPFSPRGVETLVAMGVPAIKVASTDLNHAPLLSAAAGTGLPMIVSTGAATREEITAGVDALRGLGAGRRLILLHCVSCYPAPPDRANLRAIGAHRAAFHVPCGFSDHTVSTRTGAWAVAAGACVIEKHFTLDRTAAGPDHAMSLAPRELAAYVSAIRAAEEALGDGVIGMTEVEADVRRVARRSVVAAADLPAGTVLAPEHVALKRPGGGIEPGDLERLLGRCLTVPVRADAPLTWRMVR